MTASHAIQTKTPCRPARPTALRSLDTGETLFREADPATHLFEVRSGALRLTRLLESGRRQVVAFAYPGDIVGFPSGGLHHSDCEALDPATLLAHRRSAFDTPGTDPALHRRLREAALAEIAGLQDHLLLMARGTVRGKLASFLIGLLDRQDDLHEGRPVLDLPMLRADIADYLCTSVETVSRSLTQMRAAGVIRMDGAQRIVLLDRKGLEAMAGVD